MTITTECPECQSRFFLEPTLLGKKIRCPTCKAVFTVAKVKEPLTAAKVAPPLEKTPEPKPNLISEPKPKPLPEPKAKPKPLSEPEIQEFVWSESQPLDPPSVDDTASSEEFMDVSLLVAQKPSQAARSPSHAPIPAPIPKVSKTRWAAIAIMLAIIFVGAGTAFVYVKRYVTAAPDRLWAAAQSEYQKPNYESARTMYADFVKSYPNNPRQKEAAFLVELCSVRTQAYSVVSRKDPGPAIEAMTVFLRKADGKDFQPFAAKDRYGIDIWQTLGKIVEDAVDSASEKLNADTIADVKKELDAIAPLQNTIEQLRPVEVSPDRQLEQAIVKLKTRIDELEQRLVFISAWHKRLEKPDDAAIRKVREEALARKLANDADVIAILREAEGALQKQFVYEPWPNREAARPEPELPLSGTIFTSKLYDDPERQPLHAPMRVFCCLNQGLLYGYDSDNGELLWCHPAGDAIDWIDLRGDSPASDRLVLMHRHQNETILDLRETLQGNLIWRKTLPFLALGSPQRYGEKLLIQGRSVDGAGEICLWEIDIRKGVLLGRMHLGASGSGGLLIDPIGGMVHWIADGRADYAFVWPLENQVPEPQPPRLGDSIMLDPSDTAGGSRNILWPAIGEAKNPLALRIQPRGEKFSVLRWLRLSPQSANVGEPPLPLVGLPIIDGDRIAFASEEGGLNVRQLGFNSAGSDTLSLVARFQLPKEEAKSLDSITWLRFRETDAVYFSRGALWQIRFGFQRQAGVTHNTRKWLDNLGELSRKPWIEGDLAILQTETAARASCLTAVDLRNGTVRWKRQIGSHIQESLNWKQKVWLFDSSGRIFQFDENGPKEEFNVQTTCFADSLEGLLDSPLLLSSPDRKTLIQVAEVRRKGELFLIVRSLEPDKFDQFAISLNARLAAKPLLMDQELIIALTDGSWCRSVIGNSYKLESGPRWRSASSAGGLPVLAKLDGNRFAITDGEKQVTYWKSNDIEQVGKFAVRKPIRAMATLTDGRLLTIDEDGNQLIRNPSQADSTVAAGRVNLAADAWQSMVQAIPFALDEKPCWLVVQANRIDAMQPGEEKAFWSLDFNGDSICGEPQLEGKSMTLTFASGKIEKFSLADGSKQDSKSLEFLSRPAAALLRLPNGNGVLPTLDGAIRIVK